MSAKAAPSSGGSGAKKAAAGGGSTAGAVPKAAKSSSGSGATCAPSQPKKKSTKPPPPPPALPPTEEQLTAAAAARDEARAHLHVQRESRRMHYMRQIQAEDDRSRAAAAAAKAAEAALRKRRTLLFESAFDNDREGCVAALGLSLDVCPLEGDGVFNFPEGTQLELAVDTKNVSGATAASEAAVAGECARLHARWRSSNTSVVY